MLTWFSGEEIKVPEWHPQVRAPARPTWLKYVPSPAAMSFNFAIAQYHPLNNTRHNKGRHTWANFDAGVDSQGERQVYRMTLYFDSIFYVELDLLTQFGKQFYDPLCVNRNTCNGNIR